MASDNNSQRIQDLERAVQEADALAHMKSNFLATMSHEIRTPMQTIYGLLELIADEEPSANVLGMIHTAQDAAGGLLEILDDILDLAKMDADKMELDMFEVPIRTLIYGILEALSVKVHGLDVELMAEVAEDVPYVVMGDPKRLRQIMTNLMGNAMKFTKQGSVTVRVSMEPQHITAPQDHIALRFEVIDTGIGMSKEVSARLFNAFQQADSSTQREFGGTGLGLSISKSLVELMEGAIGVESEEGKGSNFWFEIPTQVVSEDNRAVELPDLKGISVIAVEDHPQGGREIVNSLRSMGASVELCATYAEGLELIKSRPFDVGLFDQGLPDGLGVDLIKEVMPVRPTMGVIMYTVRDDAGMQHTLQSLGVKYLSKPASRIGLGESILDAVSKADAIDFDGPKTLLIAEDTESIRNIFAKQLEKLDIDAEFAEDGQQALEKMQSGEYGLLITDLHMPHLDGYGLVKTVRDEGLGDMEGRRMPVIVLTADVQMAQREVYMKHGFDECLLKPVSLAQFRGALMRWGLLEEEAVLKHADHTQPEKARTDQAPGVDGDDDLPPAIDLNAMQIQMGSIDDTAIEMMRMFADMTKSVIEALRAAHKAGDAKDIAEQAHSLKGAAYSACCTTLGDLAAKIQDDSEAGQAISEDMITGVESEFARVCTAIEAL